MFGTWSTLLDERGLGGDWSLVGLVLLVLALLGVWAFLAYRPPLKR
jgi:hypothetical protein